MHRDAALLVASVLDAALAVVVKVVAIRAGTKGGQGGDDKDSEVEHCG